MLLTGELVENLTLLDGHALLMPDVDRSVAETELKEQSADYGST